MIPREENQAYVVEGCEPDHPSVIVYAESAEHALFLGASDAGLSQLPKADLCVAELAELHDVAKTEPARVLSWNQPSAVRVYRRLGWELPGATTCAICNLFESRLVPESKLNEEGGCHDCVEGVKPMAPAHGSGSWSLDVATKMMHWSREAFAANEINLGDTVTLDAIIGTCVPEDQESLRAAFARSITTGAPLDCFCTVLTLRDQRLGVHVKGTCTREGDQTTVISGTFELLRVHHGQGEFCNVCDHSKCSWRSSGLLCSLLASVTEMQAAMTMVG